MAIRVSVLLPTYNGARFLSRAIESVLAQDYADWELLIIDDGSTDNTHAIVNSYAAREPRLRYLKNQGNLGLQKSLNRGLEAAQGTYIARIDDDDAWAAPDKLSKQVAFLDANADHALVGTGVVVIDEQGKELFRFLNPETDAELRSQMLYRNYFSHASVLFRRSVALQFGGYSEEAAARHIEDYDLWLKMGTVAKLANLPIYALRFTLRPRTISARHKRIQLLRQFRLMQKFRKAYPGYASAFIKSSLRLIAYTLFFWALTEPVRRFVLRLYKR